jgi:hypothetical protein
LFFFFSFFFSCLIIRWRDAHADDLSQCLR